MGRPLRHSSRAPFEIGRVKVIVYKHERAEEYHFWVRPKLPPILYIFTAAKNAREKSGIIILKRGSGEAELREKTSAFPILYIFHPCEFSHIEKLKGHVPNYLSHGRPCEPFLFAARAFIQNAYRPLQKLLKSVLKNHVEITFSFPEWACRGRENVRVWRIPRADEAKQYEGFSAKNCRGRIWSLVCMKDRSM